MNPNTKFWKEKIMDSPKQSITCCPRSWCLVNRKRLRHHGCKGRRNPVQTVPLGRTRKLRTLANTALCCQRIIQPKSCNLKNPNNFPHLHQTIQSATQLQRKGKVTKFFPLQEGSLLDRHFKFRSSVVQVLCKVKVFPLFSMFRFKQVSLHWVMCIVKYVHC